MMDKKIQKRIIEKTRMKMAISNLEKEEINMKKPQNSFIKTAATILLTIGATGGIVFAGFTAYEKIWKEPREYNVHEEKPPIISTVEKEKYVTEELIQEKANKFLAIAGYPDKQIKKIEIHRDYSDNSNAYYSAMTENEYHDETRNIGVYLNFDADTGKLEYLLNNDFEHDEIANKLEKVTENQAIEISKQVLNEFECSLDGYEVKNCKLYNKNEWSIEYSKSYNGIYNSNDSIKIFFGVINKQPVVESINIFIDDAFENNEFVISEDEAINIAKAKEMELSDVEISSQIWMGTIGVLFIGASITLSNIIEQQIILELISVIGSFSAWKAASGFFVESKALRNKERQLIKIDRGKVNYKYITNNSDN